MQDLPEVVIEKLKLEDLRYSEEQLRKRYNSFYNRIIKRTIGFCGAFIGVVTLSPFFILISVMIVLESGFPILYKPQRGGYKNKSFNIMKFRTMVRDAERIGGGTTALNDSRITKVGVLLRKTKLDEIPQLLNVIVGSMSFIGPRPELLKYTDRYQGIDKNILNVRPGITDYSSLTLINLDEIVGTENADEIYEKFVLAKKNQLRLKYVANVSFKTDCYLFLTTVYRVLRKAGRVMRRKSQPSIQVIVESVDTENSSNKAISSSNSSSSFSVKE
ncbi:MAG: sugar transferase [Petrimonas sp.]|nr:sugar transferase [Petrimonas sp.]